MMRPIVTALALGLTCACGPEAALWVRIEAPLKVPAEADALTLEVLREGDSEPAFRRTFDLQNGPQFPLTASFTAGHDVAVETPMRVRAEALLNGERARPWSVRDAEVTLIRDETTPVTLELCDCPEGT